MGHITDKNDPVLFTQGVYNGKLYTLQHIDYGEFKYNQPGGLSMGDTLVYSNHLIPDFHYKFNDDLYLHGSANLLNFSDSGKYGILMVSGTSYAGSTIYNQDQPPVTMSTVYFLPSAYTYGTITGTSLTNLSGFTLTFWSYWSWDYLQPTPRNYIDFMFTISRSGTNIISLFNNNLTISGSTGSVNLPGFYNSGINYAQYISGGGYGILYFFALTVDNYYTISGASNSLIRYYIMPYYPAAAMVNTYSFQEFSHEYISAGASIGSINILDGDKIIIGGSGSTITGYCKDGLTTTDVRFYGRSLSLNEVSAIYNNGRGTYQQSYNNYPTVRHPIHWYKLQEKTDVSTLSDSGLYNAKLSKKGSGSATTTRPTVYNTYTGTTTNRPYAESWVTYYPFMSSTSDYYDNTLAIGLSGYTKYSISFWAGYKDQGKDCESTIIASMNSKFKIYFNFGDGFIRFNIYNSGTTTSTISYLLENSRTTDNNYIKWRHFCILFDKYMSRCSDVLAPEINNQSIWMLYIDGAYITSATTTVIIDNGIKLGGNNQATGNINETQVFDVRVFNYALSEREVLQLHNNHQVIMY